MARVKLSEYRAKTILSEALGQHYAGRSVDASKSIREQLESLDKSQKYVVKVDQAIKKRMKQGLVLLDQSFEQLESAVQQLAEKGFRYCLVEPMVAHDGDQERYLSFGYDRDNNQLTYSQSGGIDIEEQADAVSHLEVTDENLSKAAAELGVEASFLQTLAKTFDDIYASFLEINPLALVDGKPFMLDVALEVDGEAAHLAHKYWTADDIRVYRRQTPEEVAVAELAVQSRASLRYEVINPNGSVFLLLSGGGASIVVADEVNNRGFGEQLGNYGEYSGNPSAAETEAYTHELLTTLLKSEAPKKVMIIAGAVANFTDVRATFSGVIKAIEGLAEDLRKQGVKVYVRRGGPHQEAGLANMQKCLEDCGLLGAVHGPDLPLAESVTAALAELGSE